jgi:ADP-ribose pyrophosphatase YjhB (NUDIX family)
MTYHDIVGGLFFYIEEAFWFLIDTVERLFGRAKFTFELFVQCWHEFVGIPGLTRGASVREMLDEFEQYKKEVPISCAIMVSEDLEHVLLVRAAMSKKKHWMLPGGKIKVHESESPRACVVRETLEETGLDISLIHMREERMAIFGRTVHVFLAVGVPKTKVIPPNPKEIKEARWFELQQVLESKVPKMSIIIQKMLPVIRAELGRRHSKGTSTTKAPLPHTKAPLPHTKAPLPHTRAPLPHTRAPLPHTKAPLPHTRAPLPHTRAPLPHTRAPLPHTRASQHPDRQ